MEDFWAARKDKSDGDVSKQTHDQRDLATQATISCALGLGAFIAFCILRPRWETLYAARKRQRRSASKLPDLPNTFLGWIPVLYNITEDEVLASAGLDAFVFLAFFRMAVKFLAFVLFFSLTVIYPVHKNFDTSDGLPNGEHDGKNGTAPHNGTSARQLNPRTWDMGIETSTDFLWIYVVFVYLFSGVLMAMIVSETKRIIRIRQKYLGTHTSLTDRTIKLSGIPPRLQSEEKIKETIENLEIGKVESVMLCKVWEELDDLMEERKIVLRKLETAWTVHLGPGGIEQSPEELLLSMHSSAEPGAEDDNGDEQSGLLSGRRTGQAHVSTYSQDRPKTSVWYGFMGLQRRQVDAIDYYEEKLKNLDERIGAARKKNYPPTSLAFVTMDSVAACQMAVQAILDPEPRQLMANAAPAPVDVVWRNTYLPRSTRMTRAWIITFVIVILSVLWTVLLLPIVGLLNYETIKRVFPPLADLLDRSPILKSLVQTSLPTLVLTLLTVAVPYLYDWLANRQGMISQGDVEMSLISKNFFFTFFNLFVLLTIFGTVGNFLTFYNNLGERLRDLPRITGILAESLGRLAPFYVNFIVLQGLGLFPFRLLEFGPIFMYPIGLMSAKTPRDYAELVQPPVFSYGFFLPQTLLIFIICIVYSVLPKSELMTLFGLIYFLFGSFVHKYQLLYAMDHRQHSTGRAWPIICNRVVVGIVVFEMAMAGQLALRGAYKRSVIILPLLFGTIWFAYFYRRTYEPLMKFIALRSLYRDDDDDDTPSPNETRYSMETRNGRIVDDSEETGLRFINPNLTLPLEDVWLAQRRPNGTSRSVNTDGEENV